MLGSLSLLGETIAGKYRVERILGEGGMGVVVAARHLQLDEYVAIKFMRREISENRAATARFHREARAAAKLKSEHVAHVYDVGDQDGLVYMVMEYLEGQDLAQIVHGQGPLASEDAVAYILQVCEAMGEAHARGIIHRDLKPENLFLTRRANGSPCIKVLDFGISVMAETGAGLPRMTTTSALVGSPLYMSPEQLASPRDVDPRTDVWSIGVVLYEILSGRQPFNAESLPQLLIRIRENEPTPLSSVCPSVPRGLEEVVGRCLQKDPAKRFATIGELVAALAPFTSSDPRYSSGALRAFDASRVGIDSQAGAAPGVPFARSSEPFLAPSPPEAHSSAPIEHRVSGGTPLRASALGERTSMAWNDERGSATRRRVAPLVGVALVLVVSGVSLGTFAIARRGAPPPVPIIATASSLPVAPAVTVGLDQAPRPDAISSLPPPSASDPPSVPSANPPTRTAAAPLAQGRRPAPVASTRPTTSAAGAASTAGAGAGVLPAPPDDRK